MQIFYDNEHRKWELEITIPAAVVIKQTVERSDSTSENKKYFDLINLFSSDENIFELFYRDPKTGEFSLPKVEAISELIYALLKPQSEAYGLSDKDFYRIMTTSTFGRAHNALIAEITDFLPTPAEKNAFAKLNDGANFQAAVVLPMLLEKFDKQMNGFLGTISDNFDEKVKAGFSEIETGFGKIAKRLTDAK